jgi:subtilisin family serine protease
VRGNVWAYRRGQMDAKGKQSWLRRILVVSVGLVATGAFTGSAAAKQPRNHPAKYSSTTILVKFERGADVNPEAEARAQGNEVIAKVGVEQVRLIKIKPGQSVEEQLAKYRARKDVVYAELNYEAAASLVNPDDPSFSAQWGLSRIHAVEGWTISPGAYGLTGGPKIAVIDTGIQASHPDLGNVDSASGANCSNYLSVCFAWGGPAYDDEGHGTHVAGIAAAVTNNTTGGGGVAINSQLIPVKVLGADGGGTYAAVTNGIAWAENHGAKVINLSLGAPAYSSTLCAQVANAVSRGILVVAAAGNDSSSTPFYPAACSGAIGVAATDPSDFSADFSNFDYPNVFISAPGVSIYSTYPTSSYAYLDGTSMASPFVAGLAALLFGQVPSRSPAEVKRILAATADKANIGSPYVYNGDRFNVCGGACTWHPWYGYGLINVQQALIGPLPRIASFTPASGAVGAQVTLTGTDLGTASAVTFGSVPALFTVLSSTSIRTTVPPGATTGPISVTTLAGTRSSATAFKVLPKITALLPTIGREGAAVTVNGTTLDGASSLKFGAVVAPIESNDGSSIQTHVPVGALTGAVSVVTPSGTSTGPVFKVLPTIDEPFSPTHGFTGTVVTLTGKSFGGTSSVKIGGVAAPFSLLAGTLRVTVPAAAVSGPISVTNAGGTSTTSGSFTVDPKITSFTPLSGVVGATVALAGSGFGASGESRTIALNGLAAGSSSGVSTQSVSWVSPTNVKFTVPPGATMGMIRITVGSAAPFTTAASFKVLPKVLGYSPAAAREGAAVTVNGTTLDGASSLKFGAVVAPIESNDGSSIQTHVPVGALTGAVSVVTPSGTSTGPVFKVLPTIDEPFSPTHGFTGTVVTLTGKSFGGTSSVKIGGVAAPFSLLAGTLRVTVPAAAVSGPISVTNAGGTSTTSGSFTVDPKITSFTPTSGATGATITVSGSGFGGADRVNFAGSVFGVPTNVTATTLKVAVPPGATTGPITVRTPAGTSAPSVASFTVTFSVTSISPTSAVYNHDVMITGIGLTGVTAVKFNNIPGTSLSITGTSVIHVNTPSSGAISGTVTVWKGTASVAAPQQFSVLDITSFLPTAATPGTDVVITGHGFTGAAGVAFSGTAATFTVDSGTQITAQVPDGATSGTVSVTGPGGTATSSGSFTVESLAAVKINEVQTDGATSQDEFVELYNGGGAAADISGCKLVYRTASGTSDIVLATVPASTTIPADGVYLFGGTGYVGLATADQTFSIDLDATDGGLALRYPSGTTIDLVGYGTLTNGFFEGTAAASPLSGQSIGRNPNGSDTGDNSADFSAYTSPTPGEKNP